ncbi:TPA: YPDG domain-containing protein, partial [Streptococcus suis]
MSNRDKNMFRNEQRFSFRKYSFGLASALIANVVFGATIAGGPVVHANTESEATTVTSSSSVQLETVDNSTETSVTEEVVATPEVRNVSLTYTVKVVDIEGAVLKTEVRTVDVTTSGEVASAFAELGEDLVPTDYKLIAGLGQVLVYENQDNTFTVTVEKVVTEPVVETVSETSKSESSATVGSSEVTNVSSETGLKASSEAAKNLNSVTETVPSSEAPVEDSAMSETMVAPAPIKVTEAVTKNTNSLSALALLAYEVRYTDSEGQVVGKTAGLVTAESKDGVATKEVSFSANDIPSGYELAVGQSSVLTKQLVENQINILSFAVVKKSEEEEIAESQLADKTVLEQVVSEADLLADEALRQVAKEQAGNTSLENAAIATKETAKEAQVILNDASATQEVVDTTVETVKASTLALADEMLKVDGDGMLTAQLAVSSTNSATVSTNATYNVSFYEDMNSRVPDFVRVSNISVNGQTITYEIIVNESNSSGYGKAYHEFALGNEVDTTSVTIVRQQRSDANSAWVNDGSWNAGTWVGGEKEYFSRSNGNILGALYPYNNARDNTTGVEVDAANINDQVGTLYRDQLDVTTRAYKYTITATARDGKNPANMAFMAGFRAGTDNRAYYVATPGVTDPVNQAPVVTVNSTEGTQLNSDSTNNKYLFVFGTTEGTTETEAGTTNAAPVVNKANATKTFATMSDPEGTNLTISYDNNAAEPRTETSLGSNLTLGTDGKIEGSFAHTAGGYYTRRVKVTDAANATTISSAFYTYAYTDKEVDTTAVTKNEGVAVTDAEIFSKLGIAVTSTGYPNTGKTVPTIPESEYTRTIVGYKQGGTYTEATRDQLPTTGEYEVKVRTRNVYGQDIYNWVTVKYNEAPDITEVGTDTNTTVYQNGTVDHYIFVFGKTEGTTEATNAEGQTAAGNAPVIDKANATKTVVSVSDPENNNPVTITYDNNAAEPRVETTLGSNLTVGTDGKLEGYFDHEAGGFHSRRIVATDSLGAKSTSNPFMTYAYTDKEVDTTPVTKTAVGQAVTNEEIFAKLGIITSSTRFPNNTAAHDVIPTVPTNEYTREIVGYRAVGGTDVTNATTATLPTSGTYEVKVRTRNIYGQDIYNWVTVEYPANTPTTATDKQPLYVFNNTAIKTVDPGTNEDTSTTDDKVNVVTLADPQDINSVAVTRETDVGTGVYNPASIGITIDTDGNASGTPAVGAIGVYSRGLTVTDGTGATTNLFPRNDEMETYVLDATAGATITKAVGESVTEDEILNNVTVATGNSNTMDAAIDSRYRKVLAPNQTVPNTPGEHTVIVRVITESNVYKDVPVTVVIPENPPATATDKKPLYVFNNTAIKTVDPGTNVDTSTTDDKVNVVTLADPQGINSVSVTRESDVGTAVFNPASIGITIDTDGNASGTPAVGAIGVYSRGLTVTDGTGATTNLFPRNDEMETYVLDATAGATITKAVGESVTEAEILDNVTVATGNSNTMDAAIDSRYRKVLAPNQTVPNTPGEHTVIVRVITESNVYKDVPVTVVIPAPQKDGLTPAYAENVVAPGASATTPPTFTNADGQSATAPTGATYAIPSSYTPPTGYTATIDPSTGAVTLTAPTGATVETVEVPVTVTYSDKSTDTTTAVFKLDTDGDGQPDVTDTDDDNDGIPDERDAQSKTPTTSAVTVNDATVVAGQPITAIPVAITTDDTQATVEVTGLPAGLTYNPTTKQIEGTPTGAEIPASQDSVPVTVTATVTDATGTPVTDTAVITIQRDTDGDGIPDVTDPDDDNDGIPDETDKEPKTPNTDSAVTPATVVEGQPVENTKVVTPKSPNSVIKPSEPVNGVSVDSNGNLTGTPDITDWKDDEEARTVNIPVTVTTDGVEKVVNVPVTIQRDTDGDGQPDVTDTDDDN